MASKKLLLRHFEFTPKEKKDFLINSIIFSFILFFFAWRTTDFNLISAIISFSQFFIISLISLALFISASKWFAIQRHYTAEYSAWYTATLIGFVISFTTYGFIPLLFPGLIEIKKISRLRHGKVFSGENKYDIFTILAMAPLMSIIISIFSQFIYQISNLNFFYYAMVFNAALAFFSLIPFTKNLGSHLFYTNKTNYYLFLLFSFCFFILTISNVYGSAILAAILAGILWLITKKKMKQTYGMG